LVGNAFSGAGLAPENHDHLLVTGSNVPVLELALVPTTAMPLPARKAEASDPLEAPITAKDGGQSPPQQALRTLSAPPADPEAAAALLHKAQSLLRLGDVAAARLFLKRAAELGSHEASAELQKWSAATSGPPSNAAVADKAKPRR
jgi:hypothetical protein